MNKQIRFSSSTYVFLRVEPNVIKIRRRNEMKRVVAGIAVLLLAVSVIFAGDVGVSMEAKANLWTKSADGNSDGFGITQGDDYLGQLMTSYDAEKGGGFLRFRVGAKGAALNLDRWAVYVKPFGGVKLGMMTAPYEVFAESINWHPIFAAALFETGTPKLYAEITAVKNLTLVVGVDSGLTDAEKPFNTFGAAAKYDIEGIGAASVMFENRAGESGQGKAQVIGAAFNFTGVPNLTALVGYAAILNDTANKNSFAQNRIEAFVTYTAGAFSVSLYDGVVLRNADYVAKKADGSDGVGGFGNRVAVKASYALNDVVTPSLRINHYMNYGDASWGGLGLAGPAETTGSLIVEPKVNFNLGNGIGCYAGAVITYNMNKDVADGNSRTTFSVPVGITVDF